MTIRVSRRLLLAGAIAAPLASRLPAAGDQAASSDSIDIPTYRGNAARTGEHPGPGPAGEPRALWQVRLGKVLSSSPSVVDGLVYIGSVSPGTREGGALHAVDGQTGIEVWRLGTALGDGIFSSPAVGDGIAVVGSYDGIVIAADAATGTERWRFQAESSIFSSLALVEGQAYVADNTGHLYALEAGSGEERWRAVVGDSGDRAFATPAVVGDVVYCVDATRRVGDSTFLRAYDAATGQERWRFEADKDSHLRGTAVVADDLVYAPTRETLVYAVELATGEERARFNLDSPTRTELAVVDGVMYVGTDAGGFHAISLDSGERRWSHQLDPDTAPLSPPTVADETVYAGDTAGAMHALDAASGDERWSAGVGSLRSSPAITGGVLYVGSNEGSLRAVGGAQK